MHENSASSNKDYFPTLFSKGFQLISQGGWPTFTLAELSEATTIHLDEVKSLLPTKVDFLKSWLGHIDTQITWHPPETDLTTHDKLFDHLMMRFEAMEPYKDGLKSLPKTLWQDPQSTWIWRQGTRASLKKTLNNSGIEQPGVATEIKLAGLEILYIKVAYIWSNDETEDLSLTMAALDQGLINAENFLHALPF